MDIKIRLFATLKDKAGQASITVTIAEPATVQQMLTAVAQQHPALKTSVGSTIVSVNKAFAEADTAVGPHDEVALFPPVSGGSQDFPYPTYFAITPHPFDLADIHGRLSQPDVGAIVSFTGFVRGQTQREGYPPATLHLEYEAYEEMAELKMAQIALEIWQRWPTVKGIAIVQRIGQLGISDHTTFVACAAGHRDQGVFDAARYGIDRLKEIVPVWKKEVGPDKHVWVEGSYRPTSADNPTA
jgi:molybdopterin synthase catalytic subunit